ncbi:hypothetical protein [Fuscovulum blasticum]|uniref:hypothetical protein n=1 Tax=Fuscovulum blasticum TaxID=1075 RepID=UPI000F4FD546|nr:hypothetical protein [Fuscovulum blasticum]
MGKPMRMRCHGAAKASLVPLLLAALPAAADSWPERKCAIFAEAWASAVPDTGPAAPSPGFRAPVEAFLARACADPRDACPTTPADLALADTLALIVVQEGMSTTFLPFACH